jgi:hypothetical protein
MEPVTARESQGSARRSSARLGIRALLGRVFGSLLGLIFGMFGALLAWLPVSTLKRENHSYFALLLAFGLGSFICLFGVGMAWQSACNQPTVRSFFMRWLIRAATKTTPARLLGASVVFAIAALLLVWTAAHTQILFHEYGHWLLAHACGYRPFRVVGGAFGFTLRDGRWRGHANKDWRFLTGGAVFFKPREHVQTWARDVSIVAAGPISTAVLLGVFIAARPLASGVPVFEEFVGLNLGAGVFVLFLNLMPLPMIWSPLPTDGSQLLRLLRNR